VLKLKFCSQCGCSEVVSKVPPKDNVERQICVICGFIFYHNPKVVVGAVVTYEEKYLLCRRNIEPQKGLWTFPAGFLENNETIEEGVIRESFEEARITIEIQRLLGTYSLLAVNQVHLVYEAKMINDHYENTAESSEVRLVALDDIPWKDLAFPVIRWALKAHINSQGDNQVDSKSTALPLEQSLLLD
jgi:ADP-ribose pyrophosphatase YjhB (NUDIX family)